MSDEITRSEIESWAQTHCSEMWSWPLGVTARDVVLGILAEQDALRARLAAVEALLPEGPDNMWMDRLRAAARGEDDRPAGGYQLTCAYCGAIYQPGKVNEPHFPSCKYSGGGGNA